jgi:hypothetical protein
MTRVKPSSEKPVKRGGTVLAPEDFPAGEKEYAGDGRKLKDSEHVGASTPDADSSDDNREDEHLPEPRRPHV